MLLCPAIRVVGFLVGQFTGRGHRVIGDQGIWSGLALVLDIGAAAVPG